MAFPNSLFQLLQNYFSQRPRSELVELPSFREWKYLRESALTAFQQHQVYDNEEPRKYEIAEATIIGYPQDRGRIITALDNFVRVAAGKLCGFTPETIEVTSRYLMTNASSLPVRVDLRTRSGTDILEETIYLKPYDGIRVSGIELYSLIGGTSVPYHFIFNDSFIVEKSLEGKHEFELDVDVKQLPNYQQDRIKMDVLCSYMGLDDLSKKDNYVVSPLTGEIRIVDLDVMDRLYTDEDVKSLQDATSTELGISSNLYRKIYKEQRLELTKRISLCQDTIGELIALLQAVDDPLIQQVGNYICSNTLSCLGEKP